MAGDIVANVVNGSDLLLIKETLQGTFTDFLGLGQ